MNAWFTVAFLLCVALSAGAFLRAWTRGPSTWTLQRRVLQLELRLAEVDRALEAAVNSLRAATRRSNLVASQPEGVAAASAARSDKPRSPMNRSASPSSADKAPARPWAGPPQAR